MLFDMQKKIYIICSVSIDALFHVLFGLRELDAEAALYTLQSTNTPPPHAIFDLEKKPCSV